MSKASRALSIPVAFKAVPFFEEGSSSRLDRSRPLDFLTAVFLLPDGLLGSDASSSFNSASFSAFLRAASACLAAAASLCHELACEHILIRGSIAYALLLSFDPFDHSSASALDFFAFSVACFCAATSAFFALPAAFLLFSPFGIVTEVEGSVLAGIVRQVEWWRVYAGVAVMSIVGRRCLQVTRQDVFEL